MPGATFKGLAFKTGAKSFPENVEDAALIRQSILNILLTERGERLMRPTFGSGLLSRVFNNNDPILESVLQAEVFTAIGKWEPRAIVQGVETERNDSTVTVTVSFVVASTREQSSLSLQLATPQ